MFAEVKLKNYPMRIPVDYLTEHDTEKRSSLPQDEKKDLVIKAIAELFFPSKNKNIQLKRTIKNRLSTCSRNEILSVLTWMDKGDHIIKVDASNYPYKIIRQSSPILGEMGESYKEPVKIPPGTPITIEVLPTFDNWYTLYKAKKDRVLSDLDPDQIDAIRNLIVDIERKFKIRPSSEILLAEDYPMENTMRHDALEYLKDEDILYFNEHDFSADRKRIRILLDIEKFASFKKRYQKLLTPSTQNKTLSPIALPPETRWEDITIKFVNGHDVDIKIKNKTIKSDFKQMGFEDSKSRKPNKQWELLKQFAETHGELAWEKSPSSKTAGMRKTDQDLEYEDDENSPAASKNRGYSIIKAPDKIKKTKQLLSQTLKATFQIDNDPFFPYEEVKAYKIKIKLIP